MLHESLVRAAKLKPSLILSVHAKESDKQNLFPVFNVLLYFYTRATDLGLLVRETEKHR